MSAAFANAVRGMLEENWASKDAVMMQHRWRFVPVFLYGPEKTNFSRYDILRTGDTHFPLIGRGVTDSKEFLMIKTDYDCPIVLHRPNAPCPQRVAGEVRLVDCETLFALDDEYERSAFNTRIREKIFFSDPENPHKKFYTEAYMYTGIWDMWKDKIHDKKVTLLNPFIEQSTGLSAFMWLLSDDVPNQVRKAERAKGKAM